MADVFISYARSTAKQALAAAGALRTCGYSVWLDEDLPTHRAYARVIEEEAAAAKAVLVIWSRDAAASDWVASEASQGRRAGKLVQLKVEQTRLPMPFDQIQCADLSGWSGDGEHGSWPKVLASVAALVGGAAMPAPSGAAPSSELALPDKPSIAVLPFANLTGGREEDYFADGMVEEIVTALSRFSALFVIASGSSLTYRSDPRGPRQIGRELGVRYLLEGSVRRSGERVRMAVKLIDAPEGAQVWTERFDGTLEDVFALQDTVANAVAGQVAPAIEAAEVRRAAARPTGDLGAYDLYLRAQQLNRAWNPDACREAIALLEAAIARDPGYARAWGMAGMEHTLLAINGWTDAPGEALQRGLELGREAVRLGDEDPEALTCVAMTLAHSSGDMPTANSLIDRALALNPGASQPLVFGGWTRMYGGRPELAVELFAAGLRLDPRSGWRPIVVSGLGFAAMLTRRFDEAIPLFRECIQLNPTMEWFCTTGLIVSHAHLGQLEDAGRALSRLLDIVAAAPAIDLRMQLGLYRGAAEREIFRSGLALAGADVEALAGPDV
jgi:adenylate cyclase